MLTIYTDGSCAMHSTRCGGWGVVVSNRAEFGGYLPNSTNQRAELTAVLEALNYCKYTGQTAKIYSDSQYVVKGCNVWAKNWSRNEWKKCIKNKDLWQNLYPLFLESGCELHWVKGHNGNEGNERADYVAVMCRNTKSPHYVGASPRS